MLKRINFKFSFKNLFIIILSIILNIAGFGFANATKAPFWLDSIGTIMTSYLFGPVIGSLTGLLASFLTAPMSTSYLLFAPASIILAMCISFIFHGDDSKRVFHLFSAGFLTGIVTSTYSFLLSYFMFDKSVGNIWGDALKEMLLQNNISTAFASLAGELFVNVPDKILSLLIAILISHLINFAETILKKEDTEN